MRHLISGTAECESYSKEVFSKATFFAVLCWLELINGPCRCGSL